MIVDILGGVVIGIIGLFLLWLFSCMVVELYQTTDFYERRKAKREAREVAEGTRLSEAYVVGYCDMAGAIKKNGLYRHYAQTEGRKIWLPKTEMEKLAEESLHWHKFDPASGRTNKGFLKGSDKEWQDYYAGGMKLLEDVEEYQAKILDEEQIVEKRKLGAIEYDKKYMAYREELEKLRNRTFESIDSHSDFDKRMKEAEGKKTLLQKIRG